jgi:hypothetical protein
MRQTAPIEAVGCIIDPGHGGKLEILVKILAETTKANGNSNASTPGNSAPAYAHIEAMLQPKHGQSKRDRLANRRGLTVDP